MNTSKRSAITLGAGALLLAMGATVQAGPLPDFTGYTRVGYPPVKAKGKAEVPKEVRAFGATVYYMVLDQKADGHVGRDGDLWGTGVKGFDSGFVTGRGSGRGRLDTRARYLYLYQVVNDSGRESAVRDASVRLLVPVDEITSWGHFADRRKDDKAEGVRGVGFSSRVDIKGDTAIRPVSTAFPAVTDKVYRSPASAITARSPFGLVPIRLGADAPVAAATGDEIGVEPDVVTVTLNAERSNKGNDPSNVRIPLLSDSDRDAALDDPRDRDRLRTGALSRSSWLRAFWAEAGIKPGQRSTVFGFTSNIGPVIEETIVTGRPLAIGGAGGEIPGGPDAVPAAGVVDAFKTGILPVAGAVPTPFTAPVTGRPIDGPGGAPLGGLGVAGGGLGGLGGLPAGVGGGLGMVPGGGGLAGYSRPGVANGGGGFGGGFGGGGNQGTGTDTGTDTGTGQGQNQNQGGQGTVVNNTNNNNVTVTVTQSQNQNQQQQQQQKQQQNQNQNQNQNQGQKNHGTPNGNVVPVPAAWLLGVLGLPAFLFLGRRKTTPDVPVAE